MGFPTSNLFADDAAVGCDWDAWFDYPKNGNKYDYNTDIYVKVKPKKYQDIEYMKLYLDGQYIRKESSYPYEWCKSNDSGDSKLRKMKTGKYKLKVEWKDKCGDMHQKYCEFEIKQGNNTGGGHHCDWDSWFEYPNCGGKYDYHYDMYVKVKPTKYQDIEYMKLYLDDQYVRKESSYPYEWCKSNSSDDSKLRKMKNGKYKLKVEIKDRCGDVHYKYCDFEIKHGDNNTGGGNDHCDWDSWFEHPNCGYQFNYHSDIYVKVKPNKYQDIEYMKMYIDGQYIRKESNYPYEWCKSNSSEDQKLRSMQPGKYELKCVIKDRCGETHEKFCEFEIKHSENGNNGGEYSQCKWDAWFDYPKEGDKYEHNAHVYVKMKPEKYQDIDYMKLYLDGQYIRKESNYPYEWCKSGSSDDHKLRNMKAGKFKLKCEWKDRCGDIHQKYCEFEIKSGTGNNTGGNYCDWDSWFDYPKANNKYDYNSDVYVKVNPKKYQDIEYMKMYIDGQYIRKESNYPYEWCKTTGTEDQKLREMKPGKYKLKCVIKDRCGDTHEKYCDFEVKSGGGFGGNIGSNCDWESWFDYPKNGQKYNRNSDVYVKVNPKKYQDVEYMKMYLDGQYIRKESSHPYEWCKNNNSGDSKLRKMKPGKYKLKVEIKDKCGKTNYKYCDFEIKS